MSFESPKETPKAEGKKLSEAPLSPEERERQENLEHLDNFISKIEDGHYDDIVFLDEKGRTFWRALHERCKATKEHSLPQAHFVDIGTEKKISFFDDDEKGQQFRRKDESGEQIDFEDHRRFHFPNPEAPLEILFRGFLATEESDLRKPIVFSFNKTFGTQEKFEIKNRQDAKRMLQTLTESDAEKIRKIFENRFDGKKVLIIDEEVGTAESLKYAQVLFKTAYPTAQIDIGAYKSVYDWRKFKEIYHGRKNQKDAEYEKFGDGKIYWNEQFLQARFATEGFAIEPIEASIYWMGGKPTHIEERYLNKDYGKYYNDRSFTVQGVTGEMNWHHKKKMADKERKWINSEEYSPKSLKKKGLKGYADQIQKIREEVSPKREDDAPEKGRLDSVE